MIPADSLFDVKLFSGRETRGYGLVLDGPPQIGFVAQDDSVYVRNVGKKGGDFDEQRSWKFGRGVEKLNDNAEGYWDGTAYTPNKGHAHNGILWRFAKGLRNAKDNFSTSKSWRALHGDMRGISVSFTPDTTASYDKALFWLRRRGNPKTLTMKVRADSSGNPGTAAQTVTKTIADVADVISVLLTFDWSGTENLTAGTTYHLTLEVTADDNPSDHWEVAVDTSGSSSKISTDLSTWSAPSPTFSMLYRIADADIARRFLPFFLDGHLYLVDVKDNGSTASKLFINGDRGKATAGASTTLTDTNQGIRSADWSTDMWAGAWVRIVRGLGKGQARQIASNTGTVLTVSSAWTVTPDTTSEYVIYSTPWFQELPTTGLGVVTGEPAVLNGIVYFPQGDSTAIREMTLDYSAADGSNHKYRSETSYKATFVLASNDRADGAILWRANNDTVSVSFSLVQAWGTDLVFNTAIPCGDMTYVITGINEKDYGALFVLKENGNGVVTSNQYTTLRGGMEDTPAATNGAANVVMNKFFFHSWLHTLVRIFGSSNDDVGQDYRSAGLPDGRSGVFAYLDVYISTLLCAIDAGTAGTSSVMAFDSIGWHEILRGYGVGQRIRMVKSQPCPSTRNIVWTDIGGELVYQVMPLNKSAPLLDSGMLYEAESVIESATIDMGTASDLPKFIKSLAVTVKNLSAEGREVYLDYQVDENVHTTSWIEATTLTQSPESVGILRLNNIRRFAYRLRMVTNDSSKPIDIEGVVPNGYARTSVKLVWTMRIKAGGIYQVGTDSVMSTSKLFRWLADNARLPYAVRMESKYEEMDGFECVIHPPKMAPYKPPQFGEPGEATMTLVLEEI